MKMNKWMVALVGLQLFLTVPTANAEQILPKIKVYNQIVALQKDPVIDNNRTYLTAEDMAALLNANLKTNTEVAILQVGKTELIYNRKGGQTNAALQQNNRIYLPLRFTLEKLGHQIKWEDKSKMAEIIVKESPDSFILLSPDSMTEQEKSFIQEVKNQKGVHQQGNLFVVARGQSPNPGYGIKYVKHEMKWEQLLVYVQLTEPEPGKMYPQVISYPYLAGKTYLPKYTTITFIDADTGKPLFE